MRKLLLFLLIALFFQCEQSSTSKKDTPSDPRFNDYISGVTTGIISKKDNITIQFTNMVRLPEKLSESILRISPKVAGKIVRSGPAIIFSPDKSLNSGTNYNLELALDQIAEVPEGLRKYNFSVETIKQDFDINLQGLKSDEDPKEFELEGTIETADFIEDQEAEKMLAASAENVEWVHNSGTKHQFKIKGIKRTEEAYNFNIEAAGSTIGVKRRSRSRQPEITLSSPFQ